MSSQVDVAKRVEMFVKTMKDNGINANLDTMVFNPKDGVSQYIIGLKLTDDATAKLNEILKKAQFIPRGSKTLPSGAIADAYERKEDKNVCELLIVRDKNNKNNANIILKVKNT